MVGQCQLRAKPVSCSGLLAAALRIEQILFIVFLRQVVAGKVPDVKVTTAANQRAGGDGLRYWLLVQCVRCCQSSSCVSEDSEGDVGCEGVFLTIV